MLGYDVSVIAGLVLHGRWNQVVVGMYTKETTSISEYVKGQAAGRASDSGAKAHVIIGYLGWKALEAASQSV